MILFILKPSRKRLTFNPRAKRLHTPGESTLSPGETTPGELDIGRNDLLPYETWTMHHASRITGATFYEIAVYKSAILPYLTLLTYCHLVWHFCKASDTRKLERLQERGFRAVFKDNNSSYEQLLEKADLPTLLNRRLQDLCTLMYKVKQKLCQ